MIVIPAQRQENQAVQDNPKPHKEFEASLGYTPVTGVSGGPAPSPPRHLSLPTDLMTEMLAHFWGQEGTVPEAFLDVLMARLGFSDGQYAVSWGQASILVL